MSRLTRDGTAEPVSRDQILRHARGQGNIIFSFQLTTSRIGNLTRLILTLLCVMTIHTYIPVQPSASIQDYKNKCQYDLISYTRLRSPIPTPPLPILHGRFDLHSEHSTLYHPVLIFLDSGGVRNYTVVVRMNPCGSGRFCGINIRSCHGGDVNTTPSAA